MFSSTILTIALLFVAEIQAHASISWPPPFRAASNPFATNINYDINSPISASQFPCSGEHKTGGPSAATLTAGAQHNITFKGSAVHGGGSCQVALSYDKTNFFVIHSWMGGCPVSGGSLPFTVPSDAPTGPATFAWTWLNKLGNREFYMNCGSVTIVGGTKRQAPAVAFQSRPDLFVANLGNGCSTPDSTDPIFPDPGPDVTGQGSGSAITGCQPVNGAGNAQRGGGSSAPVNSAPAAANPDPTSTFPAFSASPSVSAPPASSTAAAPIATPSQGLSIVPIPIASTNTTSASNVPVQTGVAPSTPADLTESLDGSCGAASGQRCRSGFCCSSTNFCGSSILHCGGGCQSAYGQCGNVARRAASLFHPHGRRFHGGFTGRFHI